MAKSGKANLMLLLLQQTEREALEAPPEDSEGMTG